MNQGGVRDLFFAIRPPLADEDHPGSQFDLPVFGLMSGLVFEELRNDVRVGTRSRAPLRASHGRHGDLDVRTQICQW